LQCAGPNTKNALPTTPVAHLKDDISILEPVPRS